jgi:hypothetical protein
MTKEAKSKTTFTLNNKLKTRLPISNLKTVEKDAELEFPFLETIRITGS